jgi:tyrosyl-tRNA synthetase
MASAEKDKINELLTRGVEDVFVKESLLKKLNSGKRLRVKLGFDPTGSKIHIGRAIILRKLKAFQDLGHQVVFIVGNFTAQIGDPSDKLEKRPMLTSEEIETNLKNYKDQVSKIIDVDKAEFLYNADWLANLNMAEITKLAESFSVQQMLARRNFKDRYESGNEISLREFMYPLMQGYDSVMVKADVEIGGFDQLFNLKAGRMIQKFYGMEEQDILTTSMLEGTDGRKMSTSWGNVINIGDEPSDMFGKIMSLRDDLIFKYFLLTTDTPIEEIEEMKKGLGEGENPKNVKMKLAKIIISMYHGKEEAENAENDFRETFEKGGIPEDLKEVSYPEGTPLSEIFIAEGLISSKTEWRRLVQEGAVKIINDQQNIGQKENAVLDDSTSFSGPSTIYKIGKRRFLKIISQ